MLHSRGTLAQIAAGLKPRHLATLVIVCALVFRACPVGAQTAFTRTYQLSGSFTLSCCTGGVKYGFTGVTQDPTLTGNVQITSISVSMNNSVVTGDPNGNAGASWQIFVGPTSPGFPVGQQSAASITYSTYQDSEPVQFVFAENDIYAPNTSNTIGGSYNFTTKTFTTNSTQPPYFGGAQSTPFTAAQGAFVQILLWGGDVGFDEVVSNVTITVQGTTSGPNPYAYTMISMGAAGADPENPCIGAYGINDLKQAVVYDCSSGGGIPYIWQNGTLTALPQHPNAGPVGGEILGGTFPLSISNSGEIVGYYADAAGARHGFTYMPAAAPGAAPTWTTLDHPLPARFAAGTPIDTLMRGIPLGAAGTSLGVTGLYQLPSDPYTAGTIEGANRSVMDVNATDIWQDFDGGSDAANGLLNSVVGDSGASTVAAGINDLGVIVGRRYAPFNDSFIYIGGTGISGVCPLATVANPAPGGCTPRFTTFTLDGYPTHALGISDGGNIAGWYNDPNNNYYGQSFVRYASGTFQIVNVTDPVSGIPYISTGVGINNLGQVIGDAYTVAAWNGPNLAPAGDGPLAFIATPTSASTPAPAQNCAASSGGCDLSNGTIPHSVTGGPSPLPGTVTESTCEVVPDPRIAQYGTCTGHSLPVAQVCPGFGATVIPDTLCGGAGPANNGFVLARTVAEGVDALSGIYVDSEANAVKALGSNTIPPCPVIVGAWAPRSDSAVEGTVPEGDELLEQTGGCGSSKIGSRGLSLYGIGLTLNTAALPGTTLQEKLRRFTESKYDNLFKTIAAGNMTFIERISVDACVAVSDSLFALNKSACAARTIVQCNAQVAAHPGNFGGSPTNPNVWGDIQGRLANLYLTINTRILGNPPNGTWPVPLSSAPACKE